MVRACQSAVTSLQLPAHFVFSNSATASRVLLGTEVDAACSCLTSSLNSSSSMNPFLSDTYDDQKTRVQNRVSRVEDLPLSNTKKQSDATSGCFKMLSCLGAPFAKVASRAAHSHFKISTCPNMQYVQQAWTNSLYRGATASKHEHVHHSSAFPTHHSYPPEAQRCRLHSEHSTRQQLDSETCTENRACAITRRTLPASMSSKRWSEKTERGSLMRA